MRQPEDDRGERCQMIVGDIWRLEKDEDEMENWKDCSLFF